MTKDTTKAAAVAADIMLFDNWFDSIEGGVRERVRGFIETRTPPITVFWRADSRLTPVLTRAAGLSLLRGLLLMAYTARRLAEAGLSGLFMPSLAGTSARAFVSCCRRDWRGRFSLLPESAQWCG